LGHIERCEIVLHLIDATSQDPLADYNTVRAELDAYGNGLEDKQELIALSKCDALEKQEAENKAQNLSQALGKDVIVLSAVSQLNLQHTLLALASTVKNNRQQQKVAQQEPAAWQP